jgi:hypothetical protein
MSDAVIISVISAVGLIMSGVLVELIRARHRQDKVVKEVSPNGGGSIRDAVDRIEKTVDKVRDSQVHQGERIARVEAKVENWAGPGRRSTDGG